MKKDLINIFPMGLRTQMERIRWIGLEEIRVRMGWPVELIYSEHSEWLEDYGSRTERQDLDEMLNYITGYSVFAMEEEIKQGFISLPGGHRIGITGHATYEAIHGQKEARITNIVDIGGLNIRIAQERKGCAKKIIPYLRKGKSIYNTMIFAAPGIGKTTYLRDMIRILSNGEGGNPGMKIGVIDERSEIAACINGKPQNDLGKRTDILDSCPKEIGMRMMLRTMSPQVIAVDEIGKKEEFELLQQICYCGVKIMGTIHAGSMDEIMRNQMVQKGIATGVIERFIELERDTCGQRVFYIYDKKGEKIEVDRDSFDFRRNHGRYICVDG